MCEDCTTICAKIALEGTIWSDIRVGSSVDEGRVEGPGSVRCWEARVRDRLVLGVQTKAHERVPIRYAHTSV